MAAIQKAVPANIPAIQQLAIKSWNVAYKNILSAEQLTYMLGLFYSTSSLQQQMNEGQQFIIATDENELTGFASYSKQSDSIYKLHKLYIDPEKQGKGKGKLLLDYIIDEMRSKHATQLELNVNRYNKALQFYLKNGFEIIKEEDIDIGNGYFMNDYVLYKRVVSGE